MSHDVWDKFLNQQHKYAFRSAKQLWAERHSRAPDSSDQSMSFGEGKTTLDASSFEKERSAIESLAQKIAREFSDEEQRTIRQFSALAPSDFASVLQKARSMEEDRRKADEAQRHQDNMRRQKEAHEREQQEKQAAVRAREKQEQDRKAKESAEKEAALKAQQEVQKSKEKHVTQALNYERWAAEMDTLRRPSLDIVDNDKDLRKLCFAERRRMTPKIGQLTNSARAIAPIVDQLDAILQGARESHVAYVFLLNHLAKLVIRQAETESTANKATLFPLARVILAIFFRGHTDLARVLMARLVKKCFWISGCVPPLPESASEEQKQKILGHKPGETSTAYNERMAGILSLFGAILQTDPAECGGSYAQLPEFFQPPALWLWIALMARSPIRELEPTPFLIESFLLVDGEMYVSLFGRQARKVLGALLESIKSGSIFVKGNRAGVVRLESWIEDSAKADFHSIPGRHLEL